MMLRKTLKLLSINAIKTVGISLALPLSLKNTIVIDKLSYKVVNPSLENNVKQSKKVIVENCKAIVHEIEKEHKIPKNLLASIAIVESRFHPWTVWAKGKGHYFNSYHQACDFVKKHRNKGNKHMFIGCMQLCFKTHGAHFKTIEEALNPRNNIIYAAKLLRKLYRQYGNWEDAVMYYNASNNMESYKDRVFNLWRKKST